MINPLQSLFFCKHLMFLSVPPFTVFSSVKCHSWFSECMRPGRNVIKLMINDITSTWQTGNHGDTTLNKRSVPTERGKEARGEGTARTQMRWERTEKRVEQQDFYSSRIVLVGCFYSREGGHIAQPEKGSPYTTNYHCVRKRWHNCFSISFRNIFMVSYVLSDSISFGFWKLLQSTNDLKRLPPIFIHYTSFRPPCSSFYFCLLIFD